MIIRTSGYHIESPDWPREVFAATWGGAGPPPDGDVSYTRAAMQHDVSKFDAAIRRIRSLFP